MNENEYCEGCGTGNPGHLWDDGEWLCSKCSAIKDKAEAGTVPMETLLRPRESEKVEIVNLPAHLRPIKAKYDLDSAPPYDVDAVPKFFRSILDEIATLVAELRLTGSHLTANGWTIFEKPNRLNVPPERYAEFEKAIEDVLGPLINDGIQRTETVYRGMVVSKNPGPLQVWHVDAPNDPVVD